MRFGNEYVSPDAPGYTADDLRRMDYIRAMAASASAPPISLSYARINRTEGDYLSRAVSGMSDASGFTFLWRGKLTANSTLTHQLLNFWESSGGTIQLYISRVNSAGGSKIRVRTYNGGSITATCDSTPTYTYTDGLETFLISGQAGGTIKIYRGSTDAEIGSASWASGNIDFSASLAAQVGRETTSARGDFDTGIIWFDTTYRDITSASVRRQFYNAAGLPVEPPAGALIDLRGPTLTTNNGSLGDFTATGTLVAVPSPYSHDAVRFTSADSQRLTNSTNLSAPNAQYATFAGKIRWTSSYGTAAQRIMSGGSALSINKANSTNALTFSLNDTSTALETTGLKTLVDLDNYDNQWVTFHVAVNGNAAGGLVNAWVNGVQVVTDSAFTLYTSGTFDFSAITSWLIGATTAPGAFLNMDVGFLWFGCGDSTYHITTPATFYSSGDVDLGTDGRLSGAPAPQIFVGGLQQAADYVTNLGSGGNFTFGGTGSLTDV